MASIATHTDVVDVIATEMSRGVERAVDRWMSQINDVLTDDSLTSLGRLNAVREIVERYNCITGKSLRQGQQR
jgi:hypothetical protein